VIVADFAVSADQHRYELAIASFERGVAVDVDDLQLKTRAGLQFPEAGDHVVAQVAIRAPVNGELDDALARYSMRNGM
jgi:hypothetical protein